MRIRIVATLLVLMITIGLSACGNKGPLFIPEEEEKTEKSE